MGWDNLADGVLKTSISTFKTDDPAIYVRAADPDNPIEIEGVFDEAHQEVDPHTGVPVQSTSPMLGIRLADLPAAPESGDTITVKSVQYRVRNVEEDGQGGAELYLMRWSG